MRQQLNLLTLELSSRTFMVLEMTCLHIDVGEFDFDVTSAIYVYNISIF